jgi:glucose/arabinose dehydrogenase
MKYVNLLIIFLIGATLIFVLSNNVKKDNKIQKAPQAINNTNNNNKNDQLTTVIATNLDTPWAIAFLPDSSILVTERPGRLQHVVGNKVELVANINGVKEIGEGGLLGITLHPKFSENNFIYLYLTYSSNGNDTLNKVVRYKYLNNKLSDEKTIIDKIPGAANHNGGRIKFGPDQNLYITTGDAQVSSQAQNKSSLAGKILRVTDEGKIASGNPFNSPIYTYGHRNPQGIAWDLKGNLWATEHGKSLPSGFDEINLITSGNNYGWPTIEGDQKKEGMITPKLNSGASNTWAPSGASFVNSSLFFGGLRGQALFEAVIENGNVTSLKKHFEGEFGRIREVILGPDNMLYITTSNNDGRGSPKPDDDKIIKVNPSKF